MDEMILLAYLRGECSDEEAGDVYKRQEKNSQEIIFFQFRRERIETVGLCQLAFQAGGMIR